MGAVAGAGAAGAEEAGGGVMADPIYRAPAPLIDEQYEAIAGEPMPEPTGLTCPLCHSPAYVCHAEHTDGPGSRIHCRAASLHNFPYSESEG